MVKFTLLLFVVLAVKFTSTWPAGREVLKLFTVMVAGAEAGRAVSYRIRSSQGKV